MTLILFIFGLFIGSFLNVLIDRLPKDESIVFGRSHCDWCKRTLSFYDLLPVISFFLLSGRCRHCRKKISWQYPLVEMATGILFVTTYLLIPFNERLNFPVLILLLVIFSGLFSIFMTDLKYRIIPDQTVVVLVISALLFLLFTNPSSIFIHAVSGLFLFLVFLFLYSITKGRGMGLGDVKLAFFIGFFLGFPALLAAFYVAFLTGAAVSLILISRGEKTIKSTIPFGPYLVLATYVSFYWGNLMWTQFMILVGI